MKNLQGFTNILNRSWETSKKLSTQDETELTDKPCQSADIDDSFCLVEDPR